MSSGRDKWDESGSAPESSNTSNSNAGLGGALGILNRSGNSGPGNAIGKGKGKSVSTPSGRILAPSLPGKHILAIQKSRASRDNADRPPRRNFYASTSVDEGRSETDVLLGASSSSSHTLAESSRGRQDHRRKAPRWKDAFRPSKKTVNQWMESWWTRWTVLAIIPSVFVSVA